MSKMLEQLLQLSRLEAGQVQINAEPVDLPRFLHILLEKWQPLLVEKQIVVALKIASGTIVAADTGLLEIIVGNLLSNALKYGSRAGRLAISWDQKAKTLAFQDDGPGIPAEHLPHIFDRFYRTDASRNAKIPGTGLGLSIAKKLAALQGLQLAVTSEEGHGTTFFLQFPT